MLAAETQARGLAEQASRMKDDFLATISHELRTPLNAIVGWAGLLESSRSDVGMLDEGLEVIRRNAQSQSQLIEDILDMSRITSGKMRLGIKQVDVREPVEAAIGTVANGAKAKDIVITPDLGTRPALVHADPDRLQQVFWNLLANAIKFTPRGGAITVKVRTEKSRLIVTVVDSGKGIEPAFLPYVFDRFRQADMSTSRSQGGLGPGLAIVRNLVELHGGTVSVESEGLGHGSAFLVELPFSTMQLESDEVDPIRLSTGATSELNCTSVLDGARVLVLDDEPDARRVLQATLVRCGTEVTVVATASDAIGVCGRIRISTPS